VCDAADQRAGVRVRELGDDDADGSRPPALEARRDEIRRVSQLLGDGADAGDRVGVDALELLGIQRARSGRQVDLGGLGHVPQGDRIAGRRRGVAGTGSVAVGCPAHSARKHSYVDNRLHELLRSFEAVALVCGASGGLS
jgi:hypothetical protein